MAGGGRRRLFRRQGGQRDGDPSQGGRAVDPGSGRHGDLPTGSPRQTLCQEKQVHLYNNEGRRSAVSSLVVNRNPFCLLLPKTV
jgi:hypothetical protein